MPSASAAASLSASTTTIQTSASTSTTKSHGIIRRQYRSSSTTSHALLVLFAALALLTTQPALAAAHSLQQDRAAVPIATFPEFELDGTGAGSRVRQDLVIFNYSSNYVYAGCYNDTNKLENTTMVHALRHVLLGEGYLTAPMCLEWCAHNGTATLGRPYKFAGLQYSRYVLRNPVSPHFRTFSFFVTRNCTRSGEYG